MSSWASEVLAVLWYMLLKTVINIQWGSYLKTSRRDPLRPATFSCCGLCSYCCSVNSRRSSSRLPYSSHKSSSVAFKECFVSDKSGMKNVFVAFALLRSMYLLLSTLSESTWILRSSHASLCWCSSGERITLTTASCLSTNNRSSLSSNFWPSFTPFLGCSGSPLTALQQAPPPAPPLSINAIC